MATRRSTSRSNKHDLEAAVKAAEESKAPEPESVDKERPETDSEAPEATPETPEADGAPKSASEEETAKEDAKESEEKASKVEVLVDGITFGTVVHSKGDIVEVKKSLSEAAQREAFGRLLYKKV